MRVLACVLAVLLASPALAQGPPPANVTIVTGLKGHVRVVGADGSSRELQLFDAVPADGQVETGEDGQLELMKPDGSVLRLGPSTSLAGTATLIGHAELRSTVEAPVPGLPGARVLAGAEVVVEVGPTGARLSVVTGTARTPGGELLGPGETAQGPGAPIGPAAPAVVPAPVTAPDTTLVAPAAVAPPPEQLGLPEAEVAGPPGALTTDTGTAQVQIQ